jgi:hypothetical protein
VSFLCAIEMKALRDKTGKNQRTPQHAWPGPKLFCTFVCVLTFHKGVMCKDQILNATKHIKRMVCGSIPRSLKFPRQSLT